MKQETKTKPSSRRELTADELRTIAGGDGGALTGSGEEAAGTLIPVKVKHNI